MAWVRRVRSASGATAVQIAESVAGRRRIVRHVGSARDEAELRLLTHEAHRLLADDQQGVLDLGITPPVPKAALVAPAARVGLFACDVRVIDTPATAHEPLVSPEQSQPLGPEPP